MRAVAEALSSWCPPAAPGYVEELSLETGLEIWRYSEGMSDPRSCSSVLSYLIFMLGSYFRDCDWMQNKLDLGSATIHAYTSLFLLVVVPMVLVNVLGVAHTGQSIRVISRCAIVVIYAVYRLLPYHQVRLLKVCSHSVEEADNGGDRRLAAASIVTAKSLDTAVSAHGHISQLRASVVLAQAREPGRGRPTHGGRWQLTVGRSGDTAAAHGSHIISATLAMRLFSNAAQLAVRTSIKGRLAPLMTGLHRRWRHARPGMRCATSCTQWRWHPVATR